MKVYDFSVNNGSGEAVSLSTYEGKVLLIVNTATKCGLTPQYEELVTLYEKYKDKGFEILDFPSNQFKEQAPESDQEINAFCSLNFGTTFPRFQKTDVNGENASELYQWLKQQAPKDKGNLKTKAFEVAVSALRSHKEPADIVWNFGKFLIDREGNVVDRYSPALSPKELEKDIEKLL